MNSTAILLATCDGLLNRDLIDQGPVWVTQGTEQQQSERGAGVMALYSMLAGDDCRSCKGAFETWSD